MKKLRSILLIGTMLLSTWAMAEVVLLQSGKSMTGDIVLQNDEVVILRDQEGRRFQFPRAEVVSITVPEVIEQVVVEEKVVNDNKDNCALRLDLSGGALFVPSFNNGGCGSIDLQIGSRRIGNMPVFLGGSVGYQAAISDKLNNFLPIMAVVSVPLINGRHAPELGAAMGYGFALKSPSKGGMTAKLDISWRYQYQKNSAFLLGVQARFQQAEVKLQETVEGKEYTTATGRNFVSLGLRMAFQF